jgi:pyruvate dehydrogenase E2 component (dihydrolipoamide acetyltransferase)
VQTDVVMDYAIAFRTQIKDAGLNAPSFNDLIVKAAALALRAHPRVNGSYQDGRFELYSRVNVGVAVAGDDALVVPTVFNADTKSLGAIATEHGAWPPVCATAASPRPSSPVRRSPSRTWACTG